MIRFFPLILLCTGVVLSSCKTSSGEKRQEAQAVPQNTGPSANSVPGAQTSFRTPAGTFKFDCTVSYDEQIGQDFVNYEAKVVFKTSDWTTENKAAKNIDPNNWRATRAVPTRILTSLRPQRAANHVIFITLYDETKNDGETFCVLPKLIAEPATTQTPTTTVEACGLFKDNKTAQAKTTLTYVPVENGAQQPSRTVVLGMRATCMLSR